MISNFHTSSSGQDDYYGQPAPGAYYTFSGFENGTNGKGSTGGGSKDKNAKPKRRGLGARFGRFSGADKRQVVPSSSDTISDMSHGGQSLSYSIGSSHQSAGESTDGSDFSGILKVLDVEDRKRLSPLEQKLAQDSGLSKRHNRSIQSASSSLNYSDTDDSARTPYRGLTRGLSTNSYSSTDYSTDQESQLEGARLLPMLVDDAKKRKNRTPARLLGDDDDDSKEDDDFDRMFQPTKLPSRNRTTKKEVIAAPFPAAGSVPRTNIWTGTGSYPVDAPKETRPRYSSSYENTGSRRRTASSSQGASDGFEDLWTCGAQVIDDTLPPRVKTALRPYLCGVI